MIRTSGTPLARIAVGVGVVPNSVANRGCVQLRASRIGDAADVRIVGEFVDEVAAAHDALVADRGRARRERNVDGHVELEWTDTEKVFDPEDVYGDAPNPTIL